MAFIKYNSFDLQFVDELEQLIQDLRIDRPSDDDVWEIARHFPDMPIFENIYLDLLLDSIEHALYAKYSNVEFVFRRYTNAAATSWEASVDDEEFWSLAELEEILGEKDE